MIDKEFSPDLNSMEIVDKAELDRKKELALEDFSNYFDRTEESKEKNTEVAGEVNEACEFVERQNKADLKRLLSDVLAESDKVTKDNLMMLSILEEMSFLNKRLADEKQQHSNVLGEQKASQINLFQNKVVAKLNESDSYQRLKKEHKIGWDNQVDLLRDWYKGVLNKDETFRGYMQKESPNYEEDWQILDYICRGIIFKNDVFVSFFEDLDLDWSENKPIVRSMVLKTLKSVKNDSDELHVADISYNWEDDSEYVKELFKITAREDEYLESLLKGRLHNWDIERIALTDKVLLKMALAELIYFPSIPTKVTINEFIEISKTFSTPKSKKFVNGILDGLSAQLVSNGTIKKSGRGLIDNK